MGRFKVYHGTGNYALNDLLSGKPIKTRKGYVAKPCFSTTLDFSIASLFATRKTSTADFLKGIISGVVVEYELGGVDGKDYQRANDPCLQDEKEIAVFSVNCLKPLAVWRRSIQGEWQQEKIA